MVQIEIEFQYEKELLVEALSFQMKKVRRRGLIIGFGFISLIIASICVSIFILKEPFKLSDISSYYVIFFLIMIFALSLLLRMPTMGANKILQENSFKKSRKWIINETNIQVITEQSNSNMQWSMFQKAAIQKNFILLYPNSHSSHIIPTNCFKGNDLELFKSWIRKNIKDIVE